MAGNQGRIRRVTASVIGVLVIGGVVAGCAGFRVERDGRKTGDAICDIRDASSAEEAQSALADAQKWIDKAAKITGRPVDEDVRDIQENLSDLVEHVANGNESLVQQDLAAIQRNVEAIEGTTSNRVQRFYQGLDQGLSNCSD
jgi:soluble cytochrome b562